MFTEIGRVEYSTGAELEIGAEVLYTGSNLSVIRNHIHLLVFSYVMKSFYVLMYDELYDM